MTSANHRFTPSRKISYFQYSCTKLWIQFLDLGILSSYFERTNPYIMPYLIKVTLLKSLSRWFPSIYLISQCPIGLWDYNFYSWGDFPKVPATYFLQESAFHSHWITFVLSSRTFKKTIAIHCTAGDNFEPLPNPVTLCSWNIYKLTAEDL